MPVLVVAVDAVIHGGKQKQWTKNKSASVGVIAVVHHNVWGAVHAIELCQESFLGHVRANALGSG